MSVSLSSLRDHARTPTGQKLIRYTMVSVISVVITQLLLAIAFGVWEWTAAWSNVFAVGVSAIPGYYLNRAWAWGKRGRSHFMKEVLPFWTMAFIGLLLSTVFVGIAEDWALEQNARLVQTAIINGASVLAFGVLWLAKFVILNKLMFAHHEEDLPPALDGRTGIPT